MRRLIVVLALVILALSFVVWPGGGIAVRESPGGAAIVLGSGPHLRVPLYHRVYRYAVSPVTVDEAVAIVTKDGAGFRLPCRIEARVSPGDVLTFHTSSAGRDASAYIGETVRAAIAGAAKEMSTDEILSPGAAGRLAQGVSADLIARGISDDGLVVGPPGAQVIFNAVVEDLRQKYAASARRLAETSLAKDPKEALFHAALGVVLESEGKPQEAEARYLEALYLDPTALEPMSRLFLLNMRTSDPAALARLQRLLEASIAKRADSPMHHDWLGQVLMRTGQQDRAEQAFNAAIKLAPQTPEYHISLGSLRAGQGRLPEAQAQYEEALKLKPDHPLALYNLGVAHAMQGDLDKAIAVFETAARAASPSVALLNAMAQAYEQKGDTAKAADALRRSLAQRPDQKERAADLRRLQAKLTKG
jgi:tetratricopeptide (TPR) repeat protein